jgi:hypothetical protein
MTRSQALLLASVLTVAAVAFVVGAGAHAGAFGFRGPVGRLEPPAVVTESVTLPSQPDATVTTRLRQRREREPSFERRGDRHDREEDDHDDD